MAGYTHMYVIGGLGGYAGADGVNPIDTMILVGESDRMWLEARYSDPAHGPLGRVKVVIPSAPDAPDMLLDACLLFHPDPFSTCTSFQTVIEQLGDAERLDFHDWSGVPSAWAQLREEARGAFSQLHVWRADFVAINGRGQ